MPGKVQILDTYMDASVTNFIQIDITAPTVPAGLVAYYDPENAALDASGKVARMDAWSGSKPLVQSASASAPAITTAANGHKLLQTNIAAVTRLITGPTAPAGEAMTEDFSAGITISVVVQILDTANTHCYASLLGFNLRYVGSTNRIQVQRFTGAATATEETTSEITSGLFVVTMSFDAATNALKLYKNGVFLKTNTGNFLGTNYPGTNKMLVYGSAFNGAGAASNAKLGTIVIHNRALTDAEIMGMMGKIKSRYGIA